MGSKSIDLLFNDPNQLALSLLPPPPRLLQKRLLALLSNLIDGRRDLQGSNLSDKGQTQQDQ